ncbi:MAG: hypothetical protein ABR598_07740 [Candidatus Dormibacteria bacterium]
MMLTAQPGEVVLLVLVVRNGQGLLADVNDARYQLRDSDNVVRRPFPAAGTDFLRVAQGIYSAKMVAPGPGSYMCEYEATVDGTLQIGEPDTLVVSVATPVPVGVVS